MYHPLSFIALPWIMQTLPSWMNRYVSFVSCEYNVARNVHYLLLLIISPYYCVITLLSFDDIILKQVYFKRVFTVPSKKLGFLAVYEAKLGYFGPPKSHTIPLGLCINTDIGWNTLMRYCKSTFSYALIDHVGDQCSIFNRGVFWGPIAQHSFGLKDFLVPHSKE